MSREAWGLPVGEKVLSRKKQASFKKNWNRQWWYIYMILPIKDMSLRRQPNFK